VVKVMRIEASLMSTEVTAEVTTEVTIVVTEATAVVIINKTITLSTETGKLLSILILK
jgi:hypothetical protein